MPVRFARRINTQFTKEEEPIAGHAKGFYAQVNTMALVQP